MLWRSWCFGPGLPVAKKAHPALLWPASRLPDSAKYRQLGATCSQKFALATIGGDSLGYILKELPWNSGRNAFRLLFTWSWRLFVEKCGNRDRRMSVACVERRCISPGQWTASMRGICKCRSTLIRSSNDVSPAYMYTLNICYCPVVIS